MKGLMVICMLCFFGAKAQTDLKFDKRLLDCEDKWVVIPLNSDSSFVYGFVYLDNFAGLTFKSEGVFSIKNDIYYPKKAKELKYRIGATKDLVALVPATKFSELKVQEAPEWLAFFKNKKETTDRYFRLGCMYNLWKESEKALYYLHKTEARYYDYPGLKTQLFFAENQLASKKAGKPIRTYAVNQERYCDYYKTEVFNLTSTGKLKAAEEMYSESLLECSNEAYKAEMAYYIIFQYYKLQNKEKFNYWQREVTRWVLPNDDLFNKVDKMKTEMAVITVKGVQKSDTIN